MTVSIRRLTGPEFSVLAPRLVDIYMDAMGYSAGIRTQRIRVWRSEITHPGFTALIAVQDSVIIGVAYGFLGSPDHWWDRQLRRGFLEAGGPTPEQRELLESYFEIAEIHVTPALQVRGIGRNLLTQLLWNAPARHALLSTPEVKDEKNAAFGLYRSMGFTDVLRDFYYQGDNRPFAVLGRPLPLPDQTHSPRNRRLL
ncbi:GNAT family N-acetyltransferase [Corynebacterium breve]|uniref:GNAT family N-acetyltransferase n=1 Tax=Corynebacterium breve TaxID=3049799 RepID=A0ABY8VEC7_9CORY|nr:GNAT family N-acetyltransferase [Corynebacterium breve]WIM66983.1 GNAT family N-acetyltransferase [Corynebacterium breve]